MGQQIISVTSTGRAILRGVYVQVHVSTGVGEKDEATSSPFNR